MSRGRPPRRADQKGVEAIFSTPEEGVRVQIIVGGLGILTGVALTIISAIMVQFPNLFGRSAVQDYESIAFASIGVFVLTCGGGIITARFSMSSLAGPGAMSSGSSNALSPPADHSGRTMATSSSELSSLHTRLALVVFLQGCILLSLYSGIVDEYQSNPTMQEWVRGSLNDAHYLLNWGALLFSSIIVGVLVIYSLVARDVVE